MSRRLEMGLVYCIIIYTGLLGGGGTPRTVSWLVGADDPAVAAQDPRADWKLRSASRQMACTSAASSDTEVNAKLNKLYICIFFVYTESRRHYGRGCGCIAVPMDASLFTLEASISHPGLNVERK